jgi:phage-related protein
MSYVIEYYNSSVKNEIDGWPKSINACFLRITKQMEQFGANLGLPYTKPFGGGLFEIRAKGHEGIGRAFFCTLVDRRIIIVHGFIKKSQRTPLKEVNLARKRLKEINR